MKLEELAKAAILEANYRQHEEKRAEVLHALESENLDLSGVSNNKRGFVINKKGWESSKARSTKLSRELKRISLQ